jgi:RNA-directed DNA polymerase
MLHAWEKHGIVLADLMYRVKYSKKIRNEKEIPPFKKVVRGRIEFLAMVRGKDDPIYRKYLNWYLRLAESEEATNS